MNDDPLLSLRRDKTRQTIRAVFADLLLERGFRGLTMAHVAARADIGRSTLYEHYPTKSDLLRDSMATPFSRIAASLGAPDRRQDLEATLAHFRENQKLARELFAPSLRPALSRVLAAQLEVRLKALQAAGGGDPILPLGLIAQQIAGLQLNLLEPWMLGRAALRIETVADALSVGAEAAAGALLRVDIASL